MSRQKTIELTTFKQQRVDPIPLPCKTSFDQLAEYFEQQSKSQSQREPLAKLKREIEKMQLILLEDLKNKRITDQQYNDFGSEYEKIAQGVVSKSFTQVSTSYNKISAMCNNNIRASKQHAIIGAVIGAALIMFAIAISVLSHGVGLPLGAYIANIGSGLIAGAFAGSQYPKVRAYLQHTNTRPDIIAPKTVKLSPYSLFGNLTPKITAAATPGIPNRKP